MNRIIATDASTKNEFFGARHFYVAVALTITKQLSFNDHVLDDLAFSCQRISLVFLSCSALAS